MPFNSSGAALAHLTPRPTQTLWGDNYLSFDSASGGGTFAQQFLPEIYEKEVERYGNRTVSGFLKMVGAEMPLQSDQVIWSEQGRIHVAYDGIANANQVEVAVAANNTITVPSGHLIQLHDTIVIAKAGQSNKCLVTAVNANGVEITVAPYDIATLATGSAYANSDNIKLFVYGTEYRKGSSGIAGSIDASFTQFSNRPIIMRDRYQVNGSDTAQIGWVEVTSENGAGGFLWYLKSEHEARLRFEDQMEMAMIEGELAGSSFAGTGNFAVQGTEGLFAALESRGLVYNNADFDSIGAVTGSLANNSTVINTGLTEFDTILQELDKQGAIEENMMFLDRGTALSIDNMLAQQNAAFGGGASYGVFNNAEDLSLIHI